MLLHVRVLVDVGIAEMKNIICLYDLLASLFGLLASLIYLFVSLFDSIASFFD